MDWGKENDILYILSKMYQWFHLVMLKHIGIMSFIYTLQSTPDNAGWLSQKITIQVKTKSTKVTVKTGKQVIYILNTSPHVFFVILYKFMHIKKINCKPRRFTDQNKVTYKTGKLSFINNENKQELLTEAISYIYS